MIISTTGPRNQIMPCELTTSYLLFTLRSLSVGNEHDSIHQSPKNHWYASLSFQLKLLWQEYHSGVSCRLYPERYGYFFLVCYFFYGTKGYYP